MNEVKASKAAQNHAELVRAGVANGAQFVADIARNVGTGVKTTGEMAYAVAKPAARSGAQHVAHGAKVAKSYVASFLGTLFARSGRDA